MPNTNETEREPLTPDQVDAIGRKVERARMQHGRYKELHDAAEQLHLLLMKAAADSPPATLDKEELLEKRDCLLELMTKLVPISESLYVSMKVAEQEADPATHTKKQPQTYDVAINLGELIRRAAASK